MLILVRDEHEPNALYPIEVTLFGISILARDEQLANTLVLIQVTLAGILIFTSDVQLENAASPIVVILFGKVTDLSCAEAFEKAKKPIFVTGNPSIVSGTVISVAVLLQLVISTAELLSIKV